MPRAAQARSWCFTSFDTGLAPALANKEIDSDRPRMRYLVFQIESAPETDRRHIQGYVQFKDPVRLGAVQRFLGDAAAHCEKANGTADQNRDYCTKEETRVDGPWEIGEPTRQGQRTDVEALHDALRAGASRQALWEDNFPVMVRYHRSVDAYRLANRDVTVRQPPDVRVYFGPTGTGKTRRVHWETGGNHWTADPPGKGGTPWFDGYDGDKVVLLDDYSGEYNIHFFKRLLDRYPMTVQVKGGYSAWSPTTIYITSNTHPNMWYADHPQVDRDAVFRRYTIVEDMSVEWTPPVTDAQDPLDYDLLSPDLI